MKHVSVSDSIRNHVRVWDLPTRLFHWTLVVLVAINIYTGLVGGLQEMAIHMWSGYGILALVLFRLIWGFVGSPYSRFSQFVRGPRAFLAYLHKMKAGARTPAVGHNPMGAWSVIALLLSLLIQASTGLFANDDIFTEGPLAAKVSKETSDWLTGIHQINSNILFVLIALHLGAVFTYLVAFKDNLIRPMITGRKAATALPSGSDRPFVGSGRAVAAAAAAVLAVWLALKW